MQSDVKETRGTAGSQRRPPGVATLNFTGKYYIQTLLVVVVLVLSVSNANFRSANNFENILLQASFSGIGVAGMTLLVVSGAFDLSVAGLLGFCGVVLAQVMPATGAALAILVSLIVGLFLGFLNGLVVTKLRVPAFIATLGMMNIYLALAYIWTNGQVIAVADQGFLWLGTGTVLGVVPVPFLIMVVVYGVCYVVLKRTLYGRYLRAVGSSENAGRTAGLSVDWIRMTAFMIVGGCTALAGVLLTAVLSSASANMATGYELTAISAVVVGGTSLKGGQGTLSGSFTGALFFAVINSALNMFGVGAYWQYVVTGAFLISALAVQGLQTHALRAD